MKMGFQGLSCLTFFFFTIHLIICSQTVIFKGIIKDEETLKPIQEVNIKVYGTVSGTSSDHAGNFSLKTDKIPATIIFTCVGYETASYTIVGTPKTPIEFQLRPKSYLLGEVDISSKKYSYMFKDKDFSVLDYEILGDDLILLIFKYQLKQSELVLLARNGDTLSFTSLPEVPPAKLFKDFLKNVHYVSKAGNAFQVWYNEEERRIEFFHGKRVDSLQACFRPFIFKMADRLYFQEKLVNGFGTAFGFYEKGAGKKYIRKYINENNLSKYSDDQSFYNSWNIYRGLSDNTPTSLLPHADEFYTTPEFDFGTGEPRGWSFEKNESRAHEFEFYKMIYPVVKISDDNIAFFNFATDTLELMNKNGKTKNAVPIIFHKAGKTVSDTSNSIKLSNSDWRWGNEMMDDDYSHEVYTIFLKNGMVKIQRVDLETGKLKSGTVLPFPFPEKIEIYKGDAYFLVKNDGSNDKWKLVKCKI